MARKSAVLLKGSVELTKRGQAFLDQAQSMELPEGLDPHRHEFYMLALTDLEEQYVRVDELGKLVDKKGRDDPNWPAFEQAMTDLATLQKRAFGATDGLVYAIRHADDDVVAVEDEVREIVSESLVDKVDELSFTLNIGLLGAKVAQAIRKDVTEDSILEAPLCSECN